MRNEIQCSRCGRGLRDGEPTELWESPPPVCPDCQFAAWLPHCTSVVFIDDGERVDLADIPRAEIDENSIRWCDYIDRTITWFDDTAETDYPEGWVCPACGGTDFEGVHPDNTQDFVTPGSPGFTGQIDFPEDHV